MWKIYEAFITFNDNDNVLFQICMRCCVHFDLFCENWSFNFVNFLYLAFQTFDCNFLRTWRYSKIRPARCPPGWGSWGSWCWGTSGRSRAAPAAASGTCRPTDPPRRLSWSWCHPRCTSLLNMTSLIDWRSQGSKVALPFCSTPSLMQTSIVMMYIGFLGH